MVIIIFLVTINCQKKTQAENCISFNSIRTFASLIEESSSDKKLLVRWSDSNIWQN